MTLPPELKKALERKRGREEDWPTYTVSQQKAFSAHGPRREAPDTRAKRIARILDIVSKRHHVLAAARQRGASQRTRPTLSFCAHEAQHLLDDLVDRHRGRVDVDGVGRERQRRHRARGVGGVARLDRLGDRRLPGLAAGVRRVVGAAAGALLC